MLRLLGVKNQCSKFCNVFDTITNPFDFLVENTGSTSN